MGKKNFKESIPLNRCQVNGKKSGKGDCDIGGHGFAWPAIGRMPAAYDKGVQVHAFVNYSAVRSGSNGRSGLRAG
jgi:hypothetical protein